MRDLFAGARKVDAQVEAPILQLQRRGRRFVGQRCLRRRGRTEARRQAAEAKAHQTQADPFQAGPFQARPFQAAPFQAGPTYRGRQGGRQGGRQTATGRREGQPGPCRPRARLRLLPPSPVKGAAAGRLQGERGRRAQQRLVWQEEVPDDATGPLRARRRRHHRDD